MIKILVSVLSIFLLYGCATGDQQEIDQWVANVKTEIKPSVQKLAEPKKFTPESYAQQVAIDPFNQKKLLAALKREASESSKILQAEISRRKEPMEAYPLDAIQMVGSLNKLGSPVALLKADTLLFQARVGNYIGQSFGKIISISETEVQLREIAQDAAGEWIERKSSLQLQETKK
jgi:type IV pilus assembly protein PilP